MKATAQDLTYHPACELLPPLPDSELSELAEDIKGNGLLEPIVVHDGQVLDGRHRLKACREAGVDPSFVEWDGECGSPAAYVVSKNVHRRHLTASQRAMVAAELLPELEEEARERQAHGETAPGKPRDNGGNASGKISGSDKGEAREKVAEAAGVSDRYVSDAKKVRDTDPDLADEVAGGSVTLPEAKRRIHEKQAGLDKLDGHPLYDLVRTIVRQRGVPTDTAQTIVDTAARMDDADSRQMIRAWETEDDFHRGRVKARLAAVAPPPDPRSMSLSSVVRELDKATSRFDDQFTERLRALRDKADTLREDINTWRSNDG